MRRAGLIVLFATFLVGCGGGETVSPTGPVEGTLPKAEAGNPALPTTTPGLSGKMACAALTPRTITLRRFTSSCSLMKRPSFRRMLVMGA